MAENDFSHSKKLSKTDEECTLLTMEVMGDEPIGGINIDTVFSLRDSGKWLVVEYLKCDTVRPFQSHPNRYWHLNKRKFITLWNLTQKLEGNLLLINYEKSRKQFLLIKVLELSEEKGIIKDEQIPMNMKQFREFLIKINRRARGVVVNENAQNKTQMDDEGTGQLAQV